LKVHVGDCRRLLRALPAGAGADACITDPPYGDTSLSWDKRCSGWVEAVARHLKPAASIWVFGSMRYMSALFGEMYENGFQFSQDVVWEKQNGSGFHADRFRRVHEHAVLFYRGAWSDVYHEPQYTQDATARTVRRKTRPSHTGHIERGHYVSQDGGPRLMRSVIYARNEHGRAIHPTQKPVEIVAPLISYSVPPGGTVIDCFAGSGTTGVAARALGRRAILIELDPMYAAAAEQRLREDVPLFAEVAE
jgi:site-specific DNA-methyltransferase (adenine-specific)